MIVVFSWIRKHLCLFGRQIAASLEKNLLPRLSSSPPDIESLRLYLTLPECPLLSDQNNYVTITIPFAKSIVRLKDAALKVLGRLNTLLFYSDTWQLNRFTMTVFIDGFVLIRKLVVYVWGHSLSEGGGVVQEGCGLSSPNAQTGNSLCWAENFQLFPRHFASISGNFACCKNEGERERGKKWILMFTSRCQQLSCCCRWVREQDTSLSTTSFTSMSWTTL